MIASGEWVPPVTLAWLTKFTVQRVSHCVVGLPANWMLYLDNVVVALLVDIQKFTCI